MVAEVGSPPFVHQSVPNRSLGPAGRRVFLGLIHRSDGADGYSLYETSERFALQDRGKFDHGAKPFDKRDVHCKQCTGV